MCSSGNSSHVPTCFEAFVRTNNTASLSSFHKVSLQRHGRLVLKAPMKSSSPSNSVGSKPGLDRSSFEAEGKSRPVFGVPGLIATAGAREVGRILDKRAGGEGPFPTLRGFRPAAPGAKL